MGIVQANSCQSCRYSMTAARGRTAVFCLQGGAGSVFSCAAGTTAFVKQTRSQPRLRGCSRGLGCCPNKQKQRFPAAPGTAVSSLCGNKGTACKVCTEFGTKTVIPRKILYRIIRRSPYGAEVRDLKTRYNKSMQDTPKHLPKAIIRSKTRYNIQS